MIVELNATAEPFEVKKCTGYDQFIQSIHCQFFHTESSFYSHPKFSHFLRTFFHTGAVIMNKVTSVFSRETFLSDTPRELLQFALHILNSCNAITDDAEMNLKAAFDEIVVDGETVLVPCDEFIEIMMAYQVSSRCSTR